MQKNRKIFCQMCYTVIFLLLSWRAARKGCLFPGNCYLLADGERSLKKRMEKDLYFVRTYAKNQMFTGKHVATKLWVGDYTTGNTFEEFAEEAEGINRIGILRADVDNLGQTFVVGFQNNIQH